MTFPSSPHVGNSAVVSAFSAVEQSADSGDYVSVLYIIALVLLAIGGGLAYVVVRNRRGK